MTGVQTCALPIFSGLYLEDDGLHTDFEAQDGWYGYQVKGIPPEALQGLGGQLPFQVSLVNNGNNSGSTWPFLTVQ